MEGPIFRNSKRFINEGMGVGKGLLYCGEKYAEDGGCPCGGCDGYCGLTNGCPCPDCDNTLAYLLYSSGKMTCRTCKKTLIRIKVCNLKLLIPNSENNNFSCSLCYKNKKEDFIPLLCCFKCKFKMCPECAFSKIEKFEPKMPKLELGIKESTGIIYCTNNYTTSNNCICKGCDGNCGPENGCACPLCDAILEYNIYLKKSNMFCQKCKGLLMKTKILYLQNAKKGNSYVCSYCHTTDKDDYLIIYRCNKCSKNICNRCAFKFNIGYINKIVLPRVPIYIDKNHFEKNKETILNSFSIIKFGAMGLKEYDFKPEYIFEILPIILNKMIIGIFNKKTQLSEAFIRCYFQYILLLKKLTEIYKNEFDEYLKKILDEIKQNKNHIDKRMIPDIGNFMVLLLFSNFEISEELWKCLIDESSIRQMYWMFHSEDNIQQVQKLILENNEIDKTRLYRTNEEKIKEIVKLTKKGEIKIENVAKFISFLKEQEIYNNIISIILKDENIFEFKEFKKKRKRRKE